MSEFRENPVKCFQALTFIQKKVVFTEIGLIPYGSIDPFIKSFTLLIINNVGGYDMLASLPNLY
jgi:hypothetical protein